MSLQKIVFFKKLLYNPILRREVYWYFHKSSSGLQKVEIGSSSQPSQEWKDNFMRANVNFISKYPKEVVTMRLA